METTVSPLYFRHDFSIFTVPWKIVEFSESGCCEGIELRIVDKTVISEIERALRRRKRIILLNRLFRHQSDIPVPPHPFPFIYSAPNELLVTENVNLHSTHNVHSLPDRATKTRETSLLSEEMFADRVRGGALQKPKRLLQWRATKSPVRRARPGNTTPVFVY